MNSNDLMMGSTHPGKDQTVFLPGTTVGDIHSIVADFARKNLRKRGYNDRWIGDRMDELMQELWCEIQRCKPYIDTGRKNWRSYVLTSVSNYLKGWCMNNPHSSHRTPIWSRVTHESTKKKWAAYHASIPESSWKRDNIGDEPPSVFRCSDKSRQEVSEFLLDVQERIEDPITRAIVLLYASGYPASRIKEILAPVYSVSTQMIYNKLKEGRNILA